MVLGVGPPPHQRLLVKPGGEREQPPLGAPAGEALDVQEAVDRVQHGLEMPGELEVLVGQVGLGLNLEDDDEHGLR